jgi:hypothetical protein
LLALILFFPYDSQATLGDFEGSSDETGEEDENPIGNTGALNVFPHQFLSLEWLV